jgi:hypothetical protein
MRVKPSSRLNLAIFNTLLKIFSDLCFTDTSVSQTYSTAFQVSFSNSFLNWHTVHFYVWYLYMCTCVFPLYIHTSFTLEWCCICLVFSTLLIINSELWSTCEHNPKPHLVMCDSEVYMKKQIWPHMKIPTIWYSSVSSELSISLCHLPPKSFSFSLTLNWKLLDPLFFFWMLLHVILHYTNDHSSSAAVHLYICSSTIQIEQFRQHRSCSKGFRNVQKVLRVKKDKIKEAHFRWKILWHSPFKFSSRRGVDNLGKIP